MSKTKKSVLVVIAVIVLVTVYVYYRYATKVFDTYKYEEEERAPSMTNVPAGSKEVSSVIKYWATEDKEDTLRFVLTVDKDGVIINAQTLDAATNQVPEKKIEFNEGLVLTLKGKKLSELTAIDKIGTSSLTTKAFNDALGDLKSQL